MRHVLVELSFKVHRGFETERAVEPRPVVKDLVPLEDRRARLGARGEGERRLMLGMTPPGGPLAVGGAVVLDAAIRVMHQTDGRLALFERHVQGRQRQRRGQRVLKCPADNNGARAAIQNPGHIPPALPRFQLLVLLKM